MTNYQSVDAKLERAVEHLDQMERELAAWPRCTVHPGDFNQVVLEGAARTHIILDAKTKKPQYHMIHASDHEAAFSLMRWAEVETATGGSQAVPMFVVEGLQ